jgi:hypothetical protein
VNWRFSLAAALAGWTVLCAHEPITTQLTWSQEISRIVYRRCAGCHREGGPAPMALLSYSQVRPWAKAVKDEVLERRMPPWGAVKGFGDFPERRGLSQEEILRVAAWVEGGAPEGDPAYLPVCAGGGEPKPAIAAGPHVARQRDAAGSLAAAGTASIGGRRLGAGDRCPAGRQRGAADLAPELSGQMESHVRASCARRPAQRYAHSDRSALADPPTALKQERRRRRYSASRPAGTAPTGDARRAWGR